MSEEQQDPEVSSDAEFAVEESSPPEPGRRSNAVAWIAVLLSAVALAAVGYSLYLDWQGSEDNSEAESLAAMASVDRRIDEVDESLAELNNRMENIAHPDYSDDFDAVRRDVEERIRLLNSLPSRMSTIENLVASLAGISAGARETFLLAEGEYYLQIANAQLQLANNPELASLALGMADERITQLSDPALTDVRRAISDELAALEVMEKPDLEGVTLTLGSLARVVESLPLASADSTQNDADQDSDADASVMSRAWGSVKDAMSGMFKVTPPDQAKLQRLPPDAEYFLRSNIALQLQSARLALLRGEQAIFEQTLADIRALLNNYFDTDSEQVVGTLQTLSEIGDNVFTVSAPDISTSLRLLRQYRTLRENSE